MKVLKTIVIAQLENEHFDNSTTATEEANFCWPRHLDCEFKHTQEFDFGIKLNVNDVTSHWLSVWLTSCLFQR